MWILCFICGLSTLATTSADAELSCQDFTRGYVLQDDDVLAQAAEIARPWLNARQTLLTKSDVGRGARQLLDMMSMEQLSSECRALPTDTIDRIVATHLKTAKQELAALADRKDVEEAAKVPPALVPPPAGAPATTAQSNATRNPSPNSGSVENTLEKLRQQMAQSTLAKNRPAPQVGDPSNGGKPLASDPAALSADQRGAISDHAHECWAKEAGALDIDKQRVLLTVTTDTAGVVRKAEVAGDDVNRMSDPRFRAFAERAKRAILNPHCAALPLPNNILGKVNVLTFRFSP